MRKNIFRSTVLFVVCSALLSSCFFTSCEPDQDTDQAAPSLAVYPQALTFAAVPAPPQTLTVTATALAGWSVGETAPWFTAVKEGDDRIVVTVIEENRGEARRHTLTISAEAENGEEVDDLNVTVTQEAGEGGTDIPFHADLANWDLVWSDEFDGTSLDKSVWNVQIDGDGSGNAELEYYREENISFGKAPDTGEGCLILTAKKESFGGMPATSGRINSQGKKAFTYGRIDGRIKLPKTANGLWPAFWMMGDDIGSVGWPACGEIDILEMGNSNGISRGTQERYFNGACHWGFYKDGNYPMYAMDSTSDYSLQQEFNLWTMIWTPDSIEMYLDLDKYPHAGPYYRIGIDGDGEWATALYFRKPFHILFNLAVGGRFTGITGNENIDKVTALDNGPAHMYVDYIRVYSEKK